MLKRTKGRILLAMLVITGLAGTVNNTSLSNQERKFAVIQLKESKANLLNTVKGLSESQLDFKPLLGKPSIRECFYQLVLNEKKLWNRLEAAMKNPAMPEKRSELKLSDRDVLTGILSPEIIPKTTLSNHNSEANWKSMAEATSVFKSFRIQQLKYVKTTTGDLRNRMIQIPGEWVDCYQFIIYISRCSNRYLEEIQKVLSAPEFPQK